MADQLGQQGVDGLAQTPGGEPGHDAAPIGVAQGAVGLQGRDVEDQRHSLPVGGDRVRGEIVEADHRPGQGVEQREVG